MKKFTEPLNNLIPGFIVCLIISCIAQIISSFVPAVGSALFAIGIGILCGNTFLNRKSLNKGCKFSESMLLEYSIVLTGLTLHLSDILGVGISGIIFIALQMSLTITVTYLIGKRLGPKINAVWGTGWHHADCIGNCPALPGLSALYFFKQIYSIS